MSNEPYVYQNPRVGLAVMIMAVGGMFGGAGYGAYSVSKPDENTIRMQFEDACRRQGAALGEISEQGDTLTSTFFFG